MVSDVPASLTRIGFRRDARLFLTALGGFFGVLVMVLVLILESAIAQTRGALWVQWNVVADRIAGEISRAHEQRIPVDATIVGLRARYAVVSIDVSRDRRISPDMGGTTIIRATPAGNVHIAFDDAAIRLLRRKLLATALISLGATAAGIILLLLYIPKITRPIEQMLDDARGIESRDPHVDEQQYLIDTFRKSIASLKTQQEELRQLHEAEKTRADDFARVTAALTRSLSSGFMAIDAEGQVAEVNQAGREILGIAPGAGPRDFAVFGDNAFAAALRDAFARRTALTRHEVSSRTPTGEVRTIGLTTVPLLTEDGAFIGMLALFTDLTDIRRLETRVRDMQALADLGEMSAGIAHEFRNSLATILGYLRLAQRQGTTDEMVLKVRRADQEATSLSSAIDSLLSFARPVTPEAHPTDLRELASDVISRLEARAGNIEFSITGSATIDADCALLARAVENIVRNAVDAVQEAERPGNIRIVITEDPPSLAVTDNGVGMDAETTGRIFLPFQSRKPNGLGLGLPLARKIALLHGGQVRVASIPGSGSTVTIEFPKIVSS